MANRYNKNQINELGGRTVFIDTNVLIYLFWSSNSNWEAKYSTIFGELSKFKNKLVTDFTVISEFINRATRMEYNKYLLQNSLSVSEFEYKRDYRSSQSGKDAIEDIYNIVQQKLLCRIELIGKVFTRDELHQFLVIDSFDFNDKAILMICQDNDLVLLTNDKDFENADVDILSANTKLF